jgi:hypothetical protein
MLTRTRPLAIALATALLWSGFGGATPAQAGPVLSTPAGLAPGTHFRFVFATDGGTTATSANITDYDNFVNMQAGGATYGGATISWQAIGSTSTVNAIDHIGQTNDAVYLADGTKVTTTTTSTGLWSGTLLHSINEDLSGQPPGSTSIWTGTAGSGTATANPLGSQSNPVTFGITGQTTSLWVNTGTSSQPSFSLPLYAISSDLTAVPEPSSWLTLGIGLGVTTLIGWSRHRRDRRR